MSCLTSVPSLLSFDGPTPCRMSTSLFAASRPGLVMQSPPMSTATCLRTSALLLVAALVPAASRAQTTPLAQILPVLLGNTITLEPSSLPDQPQHIAHFQPGTDQAKVPSQVNEAVLT